MRSLLTNLTLLFDRFFSAISIMVVILLLLLGWKFVLGPQVTSLQDKGLFALETERGSLEQRRAELDRLQNLQRLVGALPNNYQTILRQVASPAVDTARVFVELQAITQAAQVRLVSVSINQAANQANNEAKIVGAQKIPVTFTVSGLTYQNLKNLLTGLEQSLHIYDVAGLSYAPTNEAYTITATTYVLAQ